MRAESLRIVVVDDDEDVRLALRYLLAASGYNVRVFASAEELLGEDVVADCFLFDVQLPKLTGIELAERIRSTGSRVPILLMTGYDEESTQNAITRSGLPLLRKPFDEDAILRSVARCTRPGE